jgi:hypothetical protein
MLYGLSIVNPEFATRIVYEPITKMDIVRGWLSEIIFFVTQGILLALSFMCFAYAAGAFRGC